MATNRTARVLLQYELDQASAKTAQESAKKLRADIAGLTQAERDAARQATVLSSGFQATRKQALTLSDAIDKLDKELNEGLRAGELDAIAADFVRIERETNSTNKALIETARRLRDIGASDSEISRVRNQIDALNASANRSGGGAGRSVGQNITRAGRALFNTADIGPSTDVARGLIGVGAVLDKTGGSLLQLGVAGGIAVGTLALLAPHLDHFTKSLQDNQRALTGALAAQENYYDALGDLTSEQARERIRTLEAESRLIGAQIAETQNALAEAFRQAQNSVLGDAGARALFNQLPTGALQERLTELQTQAQETDQTIGRLTQGYNSNAFAANDAAAAAERLAKAQADAFRQSIGDAERSALQDLRVLDQLRDGNSENIRKQISDALQTEEAYRVLSGSTSLANEQLRALITSYEALGSPTEDQIRALEGYRDQLAIGEAELKRLNGVMDENSDWAEKLAAILGLVVQREQELFNAEQQRLQTDSLFDAYERETNAKQAIYDATLAYNEALNASEDKLTEIASDAEAKRLEAFADANEKQLEIDADRDAKLVKHAEDHAKRIQKIQDDANDEILDAIGERDALAAHRAARKAAKDIAEEEERSKEQLKQIEEAYAKQQEAIDKALNKQLDRIQKAADKAAEQERQRYAKEEQMRQQAILRAQTDAFNAETQLRAIRETAQAGRVIQEYNHYQTLDSITGAWLNNIAFRFGYFFQQIAGMVPAAGTGGLTGGPGGGGIGAPAATAFGAGQINGAANSSFNLAVDARLAHLQRRAITRN